MNGWTSVKGAGAGRALREGIFHAFFFGVFFFLIIQSGRIFAPFLSAILAAVTLGIVIYTLHGALGRWLPRHMLSVFITVF